MKNTINLSKNDDIYINGWHKNNAFGDCHILTTVLAESIHLPICVIFEKNTDLPIHSFVKLPSGLGLDANGINSFNHIENIYKQAAEKNGYYRDSYIEEFSCENGIKFLNLWSNVDIDYYESSLEEFKMILETDSDFKNCLKDNFFDFKKLYSFEYFNEDEECLESSSTDFISNKIKKTRKKNKNNPF